MILTEVQKVSDRSAAVGTANDASKAHDLMTAHKEGVRNCIAFAVKLVGLVGERMR